jgi:hypothetical protein
VVTVSPPSACKDCETVRLSVSPTGEVLIERGQWDVIHQKWDYRRTPTKTKAQNAAAFIAAMAPDRPLGSRPFRATKLAPPPRAMRAAAWRCAGSMACAMIA